MALPHYYRSDLVEEYILEEVSTMANLLVLPWLRVEVGSRFLE